MGAGTAGGAHAEHIPQASARARNGLRPQTPDCYVLGHGDTRCIQRTDCPCSVLWDLSALPRAAGAVRFLYINLDSSMKNEDSSIENEGSSIENEDSSLEK